MTNDSSHYHDLTSGVIKTAQDKEEFVKAIVDNVNTARIQVLREEMDFLYRQLNYDVIVQKYRAVFAK